MRGGREGKHRRRRPSEHPSQRESQETACPAEVGTRVGIAAEESDALGAKGAGEENREQQEADSGELPPERGAAREISARGLVRVE